MCPGGIISCHVISFQHFPSISTQPTHLISSYLCGQMWGSRALQDPGTDHVPLRQHRPCPVSWSWWGQEAGEKWRINSHLGPILRDLKRHKKQGWEGISETTFIAAKSCACPKGVKGTGATQHKPGHPDCCSQTRLGHPTSRPAALVPIQSIRETKEKHLHETSALLRFST